MTTATATRRSCFVCNTTEPGDAFTSLPDENGIPRAVHIPTHVIGGKAVDITPGCLKAFEGRVADAHRQRARERQEDLALAALRRQGNVPRLEVSPPRGYDCTVGGCPRFFDSEAGLHTHQRREHK